MSSNKDFLPSSSPISSICAIEIEAILFLFMMNGYKSSFQECITIIVWKIERTRNQPPYCLLQQEKMAFHLPRLGCLRSPLTLPQSLYRRTDGRTLRSEPNFSDQPVTKFAYPWCSASSAITHISLACKTRLYEFTLLIIYFSRKTSQLNVFSRSPSLHKNTPTGDEVGGILEIKRF